MRFLRRLGIEVEVLGADGLAFELRNLLGEERIYQFEHFIVAPRAVIPVHANPLELLFEPSDPHAEKEASIRELIEAGDRLRDRERVAQREDINSGSKLDSSRDRSKIGENYQRIMNRAVVVHRRYAAFVIGIRRLELDWKTDMLPHPDPLATPLFSDATVRRHILSTPPP